MLRRLCLLAAVLAVGCTAPASETPDPSTYPLTPREVRPGERPVRITGTDGDTGYTVIGLSRLPTLVGSHAEMRATGEFYRVRVVVTNNGRSSVLFDAGRQRLLLPDGSTVRPDSEAMLVKRQPGKFDLGANVLVEFDLYYDIPPDARVRALRVFGGPTLTDLADKQGTDIPLSK